MTNLSCNSCGRYQSRSVTVDAIVTNEQGQILLIKRKNRPYQDHWALPGGYLDQNETTLNAALRELKEETGLSADSAELLGFYDNPNRDPKQNVSFVYLVSQFAGIPKAGDDAKEARFFGLSSLPINVAFDHRSIIADFSQKLVGERF